MKPTKTNFHYNMLGCPMCCNPLVDHLAEYEKNMEVKTVKCSNEGCDYIASRIGYDLIPLVKPSKYALFNQNQRAVVAESY